jgi:hypothetical protein
MVLFERQSTTCYPADNISLPSYTASRNLCIAQPPDIKYSQSLGTTTTIAHKTSKSSHNSALATSSRLTGILSFLDFGNHQLKCLVNILVVSCAGFSPGTLELLCRCSGRKSLLFPTMTRGTHSAPWNSS